VWAQAYGSSCRRVQLPALSLVLGGARSGKSRYAERLIEGAAERGVYCATAEAKDEEMGRRIAAHRARRALRQAEDGGPFWRTVEAPLDLAAAIAASSARETPLLVDCLTLWLSNLLFCGRCVEEEAERLGAGLESAPGPVVLVANEVGLGLVPETALGRRFRDAAGFLNQRLAARADRVVFIAAGLPLVLKSG
jgi:adenosylcobinamide kinase / adenosylcobinamide-phosphate guanylyltransferase